MGLKLLKTNEFIEWMTAQNYIDRANIESRLFRIEHNSHFGDCKRITEDILELRWKNGRRLYFVYLENDSILLLLGGLKNAQKKDIKKAKHLFKRYEAD